MPANGEMLRLARQLRGFQQIEAAKRLGIEQPFLSRIENGLAEFREEIVHKASQVLNLPASFFNQRDPVYGAPVSVHPMWRKKASVTARELDVVASELNIRVMHLRRLLEGVEVASTSDLPQLDIEDFEAPEKIAALVRAHWKVPSGPLKNLVTLAEKAGVIVIQSSLGGASISGVTFAVPGAPPIVALNTDQPGDRQRFTLAHELGHLIMHRFPTPNMEREANEFAVALLMPAADIKPYFQGRKIDLFLLASLKPEWRVSMAALLMRAHKLGCIQEAQYTYLWKVMSAKKYRLREPPELDFLPEKPTVMNDIIRVHLGSLGYSKEELSRLLNIRDFELTELYGVHFETPRRARLTVIK